MNPEVVPPILRIEGKPQNYRGVWQPVLFRPDLKSPQTFVVGVLTHWKGEVHAFRLLAGFNKFECIYGPRYVARQIELAFSRIRNVLNRALAEGSAAPDLSQTSANWSLGAEMFCSGESADAVVDRLYEHVIAMRPGAEEKAGSERFIPRDLADIRAELHALLKIRLLNRFEQVIEPRGHIDRKIGDRTQRLNVDVMRPAHSVAAFCSAWYASASTVEHNILLPMRDISCIAEMDRIKRRGLFIARPFNDPRIETRQAVLIDKAIDDTYLMLKGSGWVIEVQEDLAALSDAIAAFAA